jgi:hypothetical protein
MIRFGALLLALSLAAAETARAEVHGRRRAGLTCRNRAGDGFFLSRQSLRIF